MDAVAENTKPTAEMLKKGHLRYAIRGGKVEPHLLSEKGTWPKRLQKHLELLELSLPLPLRELRELGEAMITQHPRSRRLLQGLLSIIERGADLEEVNEEIFSEKRRNAFDSRVRELRSNSNAISLPENPGDLKLYGDLESERKVLSLSISKGLEWVRRYNLELVQGLVRQGDRVKILWVDLSPQRWKFLCRQLKFWGLLFEVSDPDKGKGLIVIIEGPLSHLGGHQTYRDRIAALVGILPQMEPYELKVDLRIDDRRSLLVLNESSGIRSFRRNFFDYEPEEWRILRTELLEYLGDGWSWDEKCLPKGSWEGWSVPEATLTNPEGQKIDLHHFQCHQKEALTRLYRRLSEDRSESQRLWLLEKPLDEEIEPTRVDFIFPYRNLPSGRRLGVFLKKI
mgnify:CR=1 FL=1